MTVWYRDTVGYRIKIILNRDSTLYVCCQSRYNRHWFTSYKSKMFNKAYWYSSGVILPQRLTNFFLFWENAREEYPWPNHRQRLPPEWVTLPTLPLSVSCWLPAILMDLWKSSIYWTFVQVTIRNIVYNLY